MIFSNPLHALPYALLLLLLLAAITAATAHYIPAAQRHVA
jgi:hypothetical protein